MSVNEQFSAALESSVNRRGGIMELIKSELKARDVAARKQLNSLMQRQPDPNSILAQNERAVENDVRQQVGQRLQSMAVKERQNQARMQRAMSGIANQAPRMNFAASGGIVGYRDGGPAQEEAGMLDKVKAGIAGLFGGEDKKQPAPFDVEGRVIELLRLRKTADEEAKARIDQELSTFDSATRAAAQMRMDKEGMQSGGIVGFDNGGLMPQIGIPYVPKLFDFSMFLAEKGIDSLAGLSEDAVNRLRQEYEAMQEREMNRPRGDSVSESQMENLSGVLKGAGNLLLGGLPSLAPESRTDSLDIASRALDPRIGRARGVKSEPSAAALADAQAEMDILNAAQRRRDAAEVSVDPSMMGTPLLGPQKQGLAALDYYDPAEGLEAVRRGAAETRAISVDEPEEGLIGQLSRLFRPSSAQRAGRRAQDAERSRIRGVLQEFRDDINRPLDELDYYDPDAPKQTDKEVAEEIIATAPKATTEDAAPTTPTTPAIDREAIDAASALAREVETTPSGEEGAARAAGVITGRDGEVAAAELASTVAQNPTPENTSRFESEIQRLMERRESPVRALSTFLTAFSRASGGSLGQKLGVASTALRATDDALDTQIVELEKLRRADQISERDFALKEKQLEAQKGLLEAQAGYYRNYRAMQENIADIRARSGVIAAQSAVFTSVSNLVRDNLTLYRIQAQAELGARDLSSREVLDKANELMRTDIKTQFTEALSYFNLPDTTVEQAGGGAGLNSPVVQNALDVIGQ